MGKELFSVFLFESKLSFKSDTFERYPDGCSMRIKRLLHACIKAGTTLPESTERR